MTVVQPDPTQTQVAAPDPANAIADATLHSVATAAGRAAAHDVQDGGSADGQAGDLMHLGADQGYAIKALSGLQSKAPDTATTATPTEGTGKGAQIVAAAKSQLGVKYVYGAHDWGKAVDCSGLTQGALAQVGVQIGGNTYMQVQQGTAVADLAHAQPGDLVFTQGDIGNRTNGHVAVYIGGGLVIAAPHSGTVVQEQDWSHRAITAIRRYV